MKYFSCLNLHKAGSKCNNFNVRLIVHKDKQCLKRGPHKNNSWQVHYTNQLYLGFRNSKMTADTDTVSVRWGLILFSCAGKQTGIHSFCIHVKLIFTILFYFLFFSPII